MFTAPKGDDGYTKEHIHGKSIHPSLRLESKIYTE